ncbi:MAG TPA: riboflavin synthase [Caldimonas sp.]|jgi:riboflavin synthase|nr:riboflavin synthase [Caldimonas sp.]HEX2541971.1 riboflavin synthase [Caldimonas sp.]
MFTGIVSAVGRILEARPLGPGAGFGKTLAVETPAGWLHGVGAGDSIALAGACMTVVGVELGASRFAVEVSAESLARTAGLDGPGEVNLEKALRAGDRLDGHLVSGHVDGIGSVSRFTPVGESWELGVRAPAALARFLALKGSIAVDGVSLTVNRVADAGEACEFSVNLIPHTVQHTTLRTLAPGRPVNLEVDLIARYVERMLGLAPRAD